MIYNWPVTKKSNPQIWIIDNDKLEASMSSGIVKDISVQIKFYTANAGKGTIYSSIHIKQASSYINCNIYYDDITVWNRKGWEFESNKTITFLEPPTGDLLTWLQQNGVKQ